MKVGRELTGVAIVENDTEWCFSKKDGVRECSNPTKYLATTVTSAQAQCMYQYDMYIHLENNRSFISRRPFLSREDIPH
jgi:hypothetical protein